MLRIIVGIAFLLALLTITSCARIWVPTFYRIDIRQGNYIDQEMVDQLQPGMTKRQVQFIMGTPLLNHPFHSNRWDYVYYLLPHRKEKEERRVTLFFQGELLTRIDTEVGTKL